MRISKLNEDKYTFLLWDHKPLTDYWQISPGKESWLNNAYLFTMGDVGRKSLYDEEFFCKSFGIDRNILVEYA